MEKNIFMRKGMELGKNLDKYVVGRLITKYNTYISESDKIESVKSDLITLSRSYGVALPDGVFDSAKNVFSLLLGMNTGQIKK